MFLHEISSSFKKVLTDLFPVRFRPDTSTKFTINFDICGLLLPVNIKILWVKHPGYLELFENKHKKLANASGGDQGMIRIPVNPTFI